MSNPLNDLYEEAVRTAADYLKELDAGKDLVVQFSLPMRLFIKGLPHLKKVLWSMGQKRQ